jgi:hypothetical protein
MLTGKDIHTIHPFSHLSHFTYEQLNALTQAEYEAIATKLNESHIAPLQGLVRDYHAALVDVREGRTLMSDCAFALEKRKKVLLNEEI